MPEFTEELQGTVSKPYSSLLILMPATCAADMVVWFSPASIKISVWLAYRHNRTWKTGHGFSIPSTFLVINVWKNKENCRAAALAPTEERFTVTELLIFGSDVGTTDTAGKKIDFFHLITFNYLNRYLPFVSITAGFGLQLRSKRVISSIWRRSTSVTCRPLICSTQEVPQDAGLCKTMVTLRFYTGPEFVAQRHGRN